MYFKSRTGSVYWYEIHGEGPPVVLLHGFTGSVRTWDTFIHQWQNSCRFIIIDLPGHGKTDAPQKTMEDCCRDIKELLDGLSLDNIHLVGYSMGGRTALSFAMLYPDDVHARVLESASPGLIAKKERMDRQHKDAKLIQMLEQKGLKRFVDYWEKIPLFESQNHFPDNVQQSIRGIRLSHGKEGLISSLQYMGTGVQPSWWDRLSTFDKPVFLLAGEYDEKYISINSAMQQKFVHSDFSVVKNAGHAIHVEQSVIFGKLVVEYILNNVCNMDKDIRRNEVDSKLEECKRISRN